MRPRLSYRWSGASFRNIHNVFHTFKLIIAPAKPGKLKSRSNRVREVMQSTAHHSLKLTFCSCVWITLPASS
jgi:hypothetical protein